MNATAVGTVSPKYGFGQDPEHKHDLYLPIITFSKFIVNKNKGSLVDSVPTHQMD